MTGEMHSSELTKDSEWGPMVRLAEELGGEIRPFDQYQGPYINFKDENGENHKLWVQEADVIYDSVTEKAICVGFGWCMSESEEDIKKAADDIKSILEEDVSPSP